MAILFLTDVAIETVQLYPAQAAEIIGVSTQTVSKLGRQGEIPSVQRDSGCPTYALGDCVEYRNRMIARYGKPTVPQAVPGRTPPMSKPDQPNKVFKYSFMPGLGGWRNVVPATKQEPSPPPPPPRVKKRRAR